MGWNAERGEREHERGDDDERARETRDDEL